MQLLALRTGIAAVLVFLTSAAAGAVEEPDSTQADYEIRMWEARLKRDPEDGVSPCNLGVAYLQKARESGDFSYYRKAEDAFKTSLKITPGFRQAEISLAIALNSQHRFKEAIPLAQKAYGTLADAGAAGVLGDALLETGQADEARKLYEKLIELAPVPFGYTRVANLQQLTGDNAGAIKNLNAAIESASTGVPVETLAWCHVQIGGIYFSQGEFDKAQSQYDAALKIMPGYHQALDHLAELLAARGEYDAAAELYLKLIARTPRPDLQQALGDMYLFQGRKGEAEKWHAAALSGYLKAAEAGNSHFYHHLAGFYCDIQENPAEALKWAKKDFERRQSVYAYDTLAWSYYKNGMYTEAVDATTHALALGTKDAHLYFHAGLIYARAGDFAKGRACAQQALAINPAFEKFHAHR